jgi:hypothetical protein
VLGTILVPLLVVGVLPLAGAPAVTSRHELEHAMSQSPAPAKTLPPVTLQDLMQALNATEANIRWWEGDGTLPKAERDPEGRLLWNVDDLRRWARSEAGQKFIARRV